jgi:hypothetical protein
MPINHNDNKLRKKKSSSITLTVKLFPLKLKLDCSKHFFSRIITPQQQQQHQLP